MVLTVYRKIVSTEIEICCIINQACSKLVDY